MSLSLTKEEKGQNWFLAWVNKDLEVKFLSPSEIKELVGELK